MPSPLTQDVLDVIEACENVSELMILSPLTPTGKRLRDAVKVMRGILLGKIDNLASEVFRLRPEVEGMRRQNAQLTQVLLRLEKDVELLRAHARQRADGD